MSLTEVHLQTNYFTWPSVFRDLRLMAVSTRICIIVRLRPNGIILHEERIFTVFRVFCDLPATNAKIRDIKA